LNVDGNQQYKVIGRRASNALELSCSVGSAYLAAATGFFGVKVVPSFCFDVLDNTANYASQIRNAGNSADRSGLQILAGTNADGGGGQVIYLNAKTGDGSAQVGYLENTNAGTFQLVSVSDARTKTNIAPTELSASDIINALQVRQFQKNGQEHRIGFVAQEVRDVFPEAVSEHSGTGLMGVAYSALIPVLVKAIQELYKVK